MNEQKGFTLLEVLVGIVIFALGMMALAQLQGNLAKGSADANARTVAANVAEEIIESARTFSQIDSAEGIDAYNDIIDETGVVTRGGIRYAFNLDVTDYYNSNGSFSTTKPTGAVVSDMKKLELTVTWNSAQEFQIDADTQTSGRLGSGSITLTDIVSSIPTAASGKVGLGMGGTSSDGPPVDYSPGENPDIVSIQLARNKFKESTTPLPDIIRGRKDSEFAELVETKFDVVTYSQSDTGATFLRREEFLAVSCECSLQFPDSSDEGGLRPTVWNGYDYTEGEFVQKPYGVSASNQQSQFCDICCRDHHDGGTGSEDVVGDSARGKFNPFRSSGEYHTDGSLSGDHKHYSRDNNGGLVLAENEGDVYLEACRLVRKDGFFRVAQDLRQETMNTFPASYLDEEAEVGEYSKYVTSAVSAYEAAMGVSANYEGTPPTFKEEGEVEPAVTFPASGFANAAEMISNGVTEQQLRARGVYLDYMTDELRAKINCLDDGGTGDSCGIPNVNSSLEIIPFYDVQLTWLARWNESPNNYPVDVSNQAISDDNAHSRGFAEVTSGFGYSTVSAMAHKGNLGLTGSDPIDLLFATEEATQNMYILAQNSSTPPSTSGVTVSGLISSAVGGVKAADVEIEATDAQCDRTSTGYECVIESGATNPRLKVSNYYKATKTLLACSVALVTHGTEHIADNGTGNWTRFNLPAASISNADIVIKENSCN